jgi:hypothetical protein
VAKSSYSNLRRVMVKLSSRYFGRRKGPSLLRLDRLPESPVSRDPISFPFALFCRRRVFFPGSTGRKSRWPASRIGFLVELLHVRFFVSPVFYLPFHQAEGFDYLGAVTAAEDEDHQLGH